MSPYDMEHISLKRSPFHGLLHDSQSSLTACGRILREKLSSADALILSLEGNWHNAMSLVERRNKYDFFGDDGEALPESGRQIIPRRLMTQLLAQRMKSSMKSPDGTLRSSFTEILTFIREQTKCPCALVESPPPIPDEKKIQKFRGVAVTDGHGVTPISIRSKLWNLQCELLRKFCEEKQVDYLPVPKEVFHADGMLDPRAYDGVEDPTHMGAWYGQFVLSQIDEWLRKQNFER